MTSLVFHPHSRRIGYRAKRKPSWKVLREFVHQQMKIENAKEFERKNTNSTKMKEC